MEYLKFIDELRKMLQSACGDEAKVMIETIYKNNREHVDAISILTEEDNIAPALQISQFYKLYQEGHSLQEITDFIKGVYDKKIGRGNVDLSFYTDFNQIRDRIGCRVVNYEKNKNLFQDVPHRKFMDLAVVYYCHLEHEKLGKGNVLISNAHLKVWGINAEELDDAAMSNTLRMTPYAFENIKNVLEDTLEVDMEDMHFPECENDLYILTNVEKYYGASAILFPTVLEAVGERLKRDYYVLPSSIHECVIVPFLEETDEKNLQQMVHDINAACVIEEEYLGETIYRYHMDTKSLEIACPG